MSRTPSHAFLLALVLLGVLTLVPNRASAGIVNVQSVLATEAEPGLTGAVKASADLRTGNVDLLLLSAAPVARYRAGDHLIIGILRGNFGKSKGARIISRTLEHLRYRNQLSKRLVGELFLQHEFDQFRRLATRALVGVGPKLAILSRSKLSVDFGAAYMLEYEKLRSDSEVDAGQDELQHRASTYLTGRYEIDDRLQLVETAYAQPRLTDATDIRLLLEIQLVVKATARVSFTTAFTVAHDSAPPAAIDKTDTRLKSSITVEF